MKLYQKIARTVQARQNCINSDNDEWFDKHDETLDTIENDLLPSGSGIDSGCKIDREQTNDNRIIINSSYHLMDEHGFYDGWLDFTVIVKPSLSLGFDLTVKGYFSDRHYKYSGHKEYLGDLFYTCLDQKLVKKSVD